MSAPALPPRLAIDGPEFIKPNGKRIVLKGVSFGSFGEDDASDPAAVAALGANCVRIPLRWHGPYGKLADGTPIDSRDNQATGFILRANFERWITRIEQCAAAGLWTIPGIDSDCGQSGTQSPEMVRYCDPYSVYGSLGRNFLTDSSLGALFEIVWRTAAARLRFIPNVAMLELFPEPLDSRDASYAEPLRKFYARLMGAVREVDIDTPFLVGARNAYDIRICSEACMSERNDCAYTGNLLTGWVCDEAKFAQGLDYLTELRDYAAVPVFVQQVGRLSADDPDNGHMVNALQRLGDARVGYAWWQWKQNTTDPTRYALHFKDDAGGWTPKQSELDCLTAFWNQ